MVVDASGQSLELAIICDAMPSFYHNKLNKDIRVIRATPHVTPQPRRDLLGKQEVQVLGSRAFLLHCHRMIGSWASGDDTATDPARLGPQ